jgi:hypothetical protein
MRWAKAGILHKIFNALGSDADNEWIMSDSTIVMVQQHAAGALKNKDGMQERGVG